MADDKLQLGRPSQSNRSASKYFDATKSNSVVTNHFNVHLHKSFLPELIDSYDTSKNNAF